MYKRRRIHICCIRSTAEPEPDTALLRTTVRDRGYSLRPSAPAQPLHPPRPADVQPWATAFRLRARLCSPRKAFTRYGRDIEELRSLLPENARITTTAVWHDALPSPSGWTSRVLVLEQAGHVVAAMFLRERTLWGLGTGWLRGGDGLGETLILCSPQAEQNLLAAAVETLLQSRRAFIVLLDRPGGGDTPVLEFQTPTIRVRKCSPVIHWQLELKSTFDETLAAFGHRSRRNLRHALRHVAARRWEFLPVLTEPQVWEATDTLSRQSTHPFAQSSGQARLQLDRSVSGAFSMGLRDACGRWLSIITGRRTPSGTTEVFWQSNARDVRHESVCTTMRALLLQHELAIGAIRLRYIGGTCPLMQHCCVGEPSLQISIARKGLRLWLVKQLARTRLLSPTHPMRFHA